MNNKLLKLIIIVVVIIIVILGLIIIINNKKEKFPDVLQNEDLTITLEENSYLLKERETFFTIQNLIQKYINAIKENDSSYIINVLDKNYIKENSIDENNIFNKIINVKEEYIYNAEMIYAKDTWNNSIYYVYGTIQDENKKGNIYNKIIFDNTNGTYSIKTVNENEYKKSAKNIVDETSKIELNSNNQIEYAIVNDTMIIGKYYTKYRDLCKNNIEEAYELLNKEYREKRFNNLQNFKSYIQEIQNDLEDMYASKYAKNVINQNIQYICTDRYDNSYIFNETSPMQFNVILDTYTIEQEKFTEEYNKANNQKKVMMNIDKFFQMINNKDYTTAYNCLADSFKQNYFKTEESFKIYIKNNLYKYNNVTYVTYNDKLSSVYGYSLILTNKQDTSKSKEFNIVMKLKEATDFEMSFEI